MNRNDDLLNIALKTEQAGCRKDDTQCCGKCSNSSIEKQRENLASENGMEIEFVNWFFDNKKDGCGNVWFMMMAAMWEGWAAREALVKQLAAENSALKSAIEFSEPWMPSCDNELLHRTKVAKETPATDSYAASLRAEGVEMLAKQCEGYATNHVYSFTQRHALEFAAQLRSKSTEDAIDNEPIEGGAK